MPAPYGLVPGDAVMLQNAATTGDGGILRLRGLCRCITVVLQSNGTTSGGTLSIEEAYFNPLNPAGSDPAYSGTWSVMQSVNASAFSGTAQQVYHFAETSAYMLKVRISSTITGGGTVTVWAWGN